MTDKELTVTAAFILASFIRRRKDSFYFLVYRKSTSSFFQFDLDLGLGGGFEDLEHIDDSCNLTKSFIGHIPSYIYSWSIKPLTVLHSG